MTVRSDTKLKKFFETLDRPLSSNFRDFVDSKINVADSDDYFLTLGVMKVIKIPFDYTASQFHTTYEFKADDRIYNTYLEITTPFDTGTISVTLPTASITLVSTSENNPLIADEYAFEGDDEVIIPSVATVTITGSPTVGAGVVVIEFCDNVNVIDPVDDGIQTLDPIITPSGGNYIDPFFVTITCATAGSTIHYTINGDDPTQTGALTYTSSIYVTSGQTIKAYATAPSRTDSDVAEQTYLMKVATPSFSPGEGTYTTPQTVSILCDTVGADIHYTLDDSDPSQTGALLYTVPFLVSTSLTIRAIATKAGMADSYEV
jgi:hypothetical protein